MLSVAQVYQHFQLKQLIQSKRSKKKFFFQKIKNIYSQKELCMLSIDFWPKTSKHRARSLWSDKKIDEKFHFYDNFSSIDRKMTKIKKDHFLAVFSILCLNLRKNIFFGFFLFF